MGKTPKKAAPGGDERNLYNRRLKATTAPSNPSETSLHKRQRESEISNRSKLTTLQKRIPSGPRKNFKSKICAPTKFELNRAAKHTGKLPGTSKEKQPTVTEKGEESISSKMQPESEEAEVKLTPSVEKEDTSASVSVDIQESDEKNVDHASPEPVPISQEQEDSASKEVAVQEEKTDSEEKPNNSNKSKEAEEHEEEDLSLTFETEDSPKKVEQEKIDDKDSKEESGEKCLSATAVVKNGPLEKEDVQSESQTDTESCSADILEFTTSEVSEASETASQNDVQKEKEKDEKNISRDISFVSYDPSIMLKDVQVKLNDCLKEHSKLFDTTNNTSHNTACQAAKDMSFGKTLRNISGRRSLSRMRHVTVREHRYSPNDSLFVNTSSVSFLPDDTADFKILRYSTGLSDTVSTTNGSPTERKRKHDSDDWNSAKKQKTEAESSLLNTSISLLKGLRRPIQVSTPVAELKFQSSKLDLEDASKPANEATKKWCVIM